MGRGNRILVIDASRETRLALETELAAKVAGSSPVALSFRPLSEVASDPPPDFDLWLLEASQLRPEHSAVVAAGSQLSRVLLLAPPSAQDIIEPLLHAGARDVIALPLEPARLHLRMRMHGSANSRALAQRREERALDVLLELTQALASTLDFQDILHTLVRRIAEVVEIDRVSIVLVPDAPNEGYVVAASDDATLRNLRLDLRKYPEIQHVLSTKQALTIGDVGTHPLLDGVRESVQEIGRCTLNLLPIIWEDEMMGVLFLRGEARGNALDSRQLGFCQVLANTTAIALRNARILQALREETRRDTHARLEAERRLRSLKGYADLFVSAVDGAVAFDAHGTLLFANPAAYELLGREPSDVPNGAELVQFIAPVDRERIMKLIQGFGQGQYPRNVDLTVLHASGRELIINGSFSPLQGTEGAALLSFRDLTEARHTQDELEKTKRFLQSMIDASVDAIVASDMHGKIVLFNDGAYRLYGYRPEEAVGKMYVHSLYPGDGAREVGRMLRSAAHGGEGRLEPVRMEAIDAHGNIFPISLTAATIYEDGRATANFGIFTDLREQTRVEQALAHAQEKLALTEKQAVVAELAGATAHELNQPLTSIMGCSELLTRRLPPDSPLLGMLETMRAEIERMAEIVRKIGDLTKYETKNYVGGQRIIDLDSGSKG